MSKPSERTISLDNFSLEAKALIGQAQKFADDNKCRWFDPAHILVVLLDIPDITSLLKEIGVNTIAFNNQLYNYISKLSCGEESSSLAQTTIDLLRRVKSNVTDRPINAFDLFFALSQEKQGIVAHLCKQFELNSDSLFTILNKGKDRDLEFSPYITNLTGLGKKEKFEVVIGRDAEVRRLIQILGRRSKNHPLLIGESGVGKRTIVLALVDRIISEQVPKHFKNTTVVQLNTTNLLSGVKSRFEVEKRMQEVLKSLSGYNVVLYVRSLENLLAPGLNLNLSDLFRNIFETPGVRVVTSISSDGLKKMSEKENNLLKEFTNINIEPCTPECAVEVLRGIASRYEKHHRIKIGETAINAAVKLAKRYVQDRFLPESAIDLLDEAASNKMMEIDGVPSKLDKAYSRLASLKAQISGLSNNSDPASCKARQLLEKEAETINTQIGSFKEPVVHGEPILTEESIAIVLGEWTGIPVSKFLEGETEKLSKMEERLSRRVVGQDEAVIAVSKSVRRSYLGLRDPGKPIGSFLFLGGSGVGKTETAKALADFLFDNEHAMIRIDCSEMQERHMAQRLIGAPTGYQGSEEGGMLTEAVRKQPYSVLLFDEIEKAHADVFNLLLQVLDDGRLTDGRGRTADFSNTIVILTSNLGSKHILDADKLLFESEHGRASIKEMLHQEMKKFLRPEFINRLDDSIIFRPLAKEQLYSIFDIQLARVQRMVADREITIKVSEDAKNRLVDIGYDPAYGARPLKRAIMKHIQDPLAELLAKGCNNGTSLRVYLQKDSFVMEEQ